LTDFVIGTLAESLVWGVLLNRLVRIVRATGVKKLP
jgi:hypothetical protein